MARSMWGNRVENIHLIHRTTGRPRRIHICHPFCHYNPCLSICAAYCQSMENMVMTKHWSFVADRMNQLFSKSSSREEDILVTPKSCGVVVSPYKAIDTPISHIGA